MLKEGRVEPRFVEGGEVESFVRNINAILGIKKMNAQLKEGIIRRLLENHWT